MNEASGNVVTRDELMDKIMLLSTELWENKFTLNDVENWLSNFTGRFLEREQERLHALYLLSNFEYFGEREIRVLIGAMYRDLYRYPRVQEARALNDSVSLLADLESRYRSKLSGTRFVPVGDPSESGGYILYRYRQENKLPSENFLDFSSIRRACEGPSDYGRVLGGVDRIVFIDDFIGSGDQAQRKLAPILEALRDQAITDNHQVEIAYHTIFSVERGIKRLREMGFDEVESVQVLRESEKAFSGNTRLFGSSAANIEASDCRRVAVGYGTLLDRRMPLGFGDGQLLIGFAHNIPDNTLPIFWHESSAMKWQPLFKRHVK